MRARERSVPVYEQERYLPFYHPGKVRHVCRRNTIMIGGDGGALFALCYVYRAPTAPRPSRTTIWQNNGCPKKTRCPKSKLARGMSPSIPVAKLDVLATSRERYQRTLKRYQEEAPLLDELCRSGHICGSFIRPSPACSLKLWRVESKLMHSSCLPQGVPRVVCAC